MWCTYKYLNSGPGSVGGCFVHERHGVRPDLPRLAGWWGHDKDRASGWSPDFDRSPVRKGGSSRTLRSSRSRRPGFARRLHGSRGNGAAAGEIGPPHRLPRMAASPGDRRFGRDPDPQRLSPERMPAPFRVKSNVSGRTVLEKLEASGVTCDWREPDVIRVAPVPLQPVRGGPPLRRDSSGRFVNRAVKTARETPRGTGEITLVGAGLAGSLLAIFLARRGHRVMLLERRPIPERPRGRLRLPGARSIWRSRIAGSPRSKRSA